MNYHFSSSSKKLLISFISIILISIFTFLRCSSVFSQEIQDKANAIDLNSLTLEEIEKLDFRNKDFSLTSGALKYPGIFRGKNLEDSKLGPFDLFQSGIEGATILINVNFNGSYNPPENFVRGKSLQNCKLKGLDLSKIGIEEAIDLSFVNFTGSFKPPKNFVKNKSLHGAKLNGLDLTEIGIADALELGQVDFTGSFNPPKGFAYEKNLSFAILSGLDLTKIGISGAADIRFVNFKGSIKPPKNFVKGKNLIGAKLWGLDLSEIGIDEVDNNDLSYVDFRGSSNPPANFARGKNLRVANLGGLDLSVIGIDEAADISEADFTDSINPPANFAQGKDLYKVTLGKMDLTAIGITGAADFREVNFRGSFNPPENFAQGKNLDEAKLEGFDLGHIGLNRASSIEEIVIGKNMTLEKDIIFPNRKSLRSWHFKKPIVYRGSLIGKKQFLKLQKLLSLIQNFDMRKEDKSFLMDKLVTHYGIDHLLNLSLIEMKKIPFEKFITPKDYLNAMPEKCQKVFHSEGLDKTWFELNQLVYLPENPILFYSQLYQSCISGEKRQKNPSAVNALSEIKSQLREIQLDEDFIEMEVERNNPEEALKSYLSNIEERGEKSQFKIKFKGESGEDGGGLRREFFSLIEKIIEKKIKEQNPTLSFSQLGKITARTLSVEDGIPAFAIDAPSEYYQRIISGQNLAQLIADKIYSDNDDEVDKVKRVVSTLQNSVSEFKNMMGLDESEIVQAFHHTCLYSFADQSNENKNILQFAQGFSEILPRDKLLQAGIQTAADLKVLVEGKKVISLDEFMANIEITSDNSEMKTAYTEAIKGIIEDYQKHDSSGEKAQKFMRDFLRFSTGSSCIEGNKIALSPNTKEDFLLAAHTCSKTIDAPAIGDVEQIKKRILKTLYWGDEGFGFN